MKFLRLIVHVATVLPLCNAFHHKRPGLTFLCTLNVSIGAPTVIGPGPMGTRLAIPVLGGAFDGPKLSGRVLPIGADWGLTDPHNSVFNADARYVLRTTDDANIYVRASGPAQSATEAHTRLIFETGAAKYYWLNDIVAVGILTLGNGSVSTDAWQLESPRS